MLSDTFDRIKRIGPTQLRLIVGGAVVVVWAIVWKITLSPMMPRPYWYIPALFTAAPGLIAFFLTFLPKAEAQMGSTIKAVAIAILVFAPLVGAYYLMVIIASPVLFTVVVFTLKLIQNKKKKHEAKVPPADAKLEKLSPAKWQLVALIVAFAIGALLYRELMHERLGHTAAMFVGIPVLMAILLALTPRAKTATGGILKGITLALLIVAPLLGEGYLCILMASPLFYLAGIAVGVIVDENRKAKNARLGCLALILLPMSLEGVVPWLSFHRAQTVEVSRVVDASAEAMGRQLAESPDIAKALPRVLRIGFPRPLKAWGNGLNIGDRRTIHFAGAEGDPPGDLAMRVAQRRPGYVRFETVADSSKLTQWIAWDSSEVEWTQVDDLHTRVTWRVHFERQLDPAWYFAPLERAAVHEAAKYLIEANAIPGPAATQGNATAERSN